MRHTAETYKRIGKDTEYTNKAIDAMARMDFGQSVKVEFTDNGKVIINDSQILDYSTMAQKAIDRQSELSERPELEKVYQDRQKRVEEADKHTRFNPQEKSPEQVMQEQAQSYMRSNASKNLKPAHNTKSNLPSERA